MRSYWWAGEGKVSFDDNIREVDEEIGITAEVIKKPANRGDREDEKELMVNMMTGEASSDGGSSIW